MDAAETVDPRLRSALAEQLELRRAVLARGARHVGWKLGVGDRERIGESIAVGFLTSETVLASGGRYVGVAGAELHADAEAVVELGSDVDPADAGASVRAAVRSYGAALEIVDLAELEGEPEAVVATNVFHRAVAFATLAHEPTAGFRVELRLDGDVAGSGTWPDDLGDRVAEAARVLAAVGERFRAGDRIITGSIVQIPVPRSARVGADYGGAARVELDVVIGSRV